MRLAISPLLVAILGGFAGLAPAWSADLSEAQIREGLQKLSVLIAAEVPPNARWVNVQTQGQRWGVFNPFGEDEFPAKGNAFLLDEKPQVSARVLNVASGMVISLKTEKGAA